MRAVDSREPKKLPRHHWARVSEDTGRYRCEKCGAHASVVRRGVRNHAAVYYSMTYGTASQTWSLLRPSCMTVPR